MGERLSLASWAGPTLLLNVLVQLERGDGRRAASCCCCRRAAADAPGGDGEGAETALLPEPFWVHHTRGIGPLRLARPVLALLAWEALSRDPLARLRRIQVESIGTTINFRRPCREPAGERSGAVQDGTSDDGVSPPDRWRFGVECSTGSLAHFFARRTAFSVLPRRIGTK
jgi:hypothetical protein